MRASSEASLLASSVIVIMMRASASLVK
jgi:hypothetical protein